MPRIEDVLDVTAKFNMSNLSELQRHTYRVLRKNGFSRHEANLVIFGMVLEGEGDLSVELKGA